MLTLTLVSISAYSRLSLPAVSYITSIDIWALTCLMFVAMALIECVIVNFLETRKDKQAPDVEKMLSENENKEGRNEDMREGSVTRSERPKCCSNSWIESRMHVHERIKKNSRVAFPVLFLVFNIVFWINGSWPNDPVTGLGY